MLSEFTQKLSKIKVWCKNNITFLLGILYFSSKPIHDFFEN